ncbi:MAG: carboxypeptidase regulatory-like domain-containing protein, partial [Deltaproteobacteria bacterium]|nr:carboxypeptidase regulatory-like domain-containing protein [Deltaproteobacteria bacterium]
MRMRMPNRRSSAPAVPSRALFLLVLCLLLPIWQRAEAVGELGGSIGGFVTIKGTKDGLASVPISVASKQLIGGSQQVITNDDGSYGFVNLPPGVYELVIAMEGFAPIKQVGIRVNAGQRSSVDIELEVGGDVGQQTTKIIEKVNPILNTESAAAVTPISNQQLTRAPTFRQEKAVAQFTAGVTSGSDKVSVRGGLGRFNRYFIDGLEVTDITLGAFGSSSALINSDSVEQFVVSVGAMDAEYNSLGLVQNMVTRSGGNNFVFDATAIIQPPFMAALTRYPTRGPVQNTSLLYDDRPIPDRSYYSGSVNFGG